MSMPMPESLLAAERIATESLPPSLLGGGGAPQAPPKPTAVTAGTPGTVTPVAGRLASIAALRADADVGDTALAGQPAWTTGQYVTILTTTTQQGRAYWDGTSWANGVAP